MAVTYQVGLRADTKSISKELAVIEADIQKAFGEKATKSLNLGLQEGIKSARLLQQTLQKATTDKGTSFIQMNAELRRANQSVASMVTSLSGAGMKQSLNLFLQTFANANRSVLTLNAKLAEMQRVLIQSFKFTAAQGAFRFIQGSLQASVSYVRELDMDMNQIAIVTEKNAYQMEQVYKNALAASRELRVAATEYAEASLIFYQQGLADDEVEHRTEITIKAAKAANTAVTDMSEQLTAVWNTYRMQGEQLENAASVAAKLGADTAVDFKYIAEAMQSAALPAAQLGVEYEQLAAIIATVGETTMQGASVTGNAYKTILARFANLKAAGEEGRIELGRISQQLSYLGVNILDVDGELRDMGDVIDEVGNNWDSYSEKQQIALAQVLGGVRQYGQLLALMQNFDKYQRNVDIANNQSAGTLEKQYTKSLETIDSAMVNSAETWKRAFKEVFASDNQIGFYNMLESAGSAVEGMVSGFGGLEGILTVVGAVLARNLVENLRNAAGFAGDLLRNITGVGQKASIQKDFAGMESARIASLGANPTAAQVDDSLVLQNKLKLSKEIALANVDLNRVIEIGNGAQRLRAQMIQEELGLRQQNVNSITDEVRALEQALQRESAIAKQRAARSSTSRADALQLNAKGDLTKGMADLAKTAAQTGNVEKGITDLIARLRDAQRSYSDLGKSSSGATQQVRKEAIEMAKVISAAIRTIRTDSQDATIAIGTIAEALREMESLTGAEDLGDSLSEVNNEVDNLVNETGRLNDTLGQAGGGLEVVTQSAASATQSLINFTSGMMMTVNGIKGLFSALEEQDPAAALGAMVMLVPGLIQVAASLGQITGITNLLNIAQSSGLGILTALNLARKGEATQLGVIMALEKSKLVGQQAQNVATALGVTATNMNVGAIIKQAVADRMAAGMSREAALAEVQQTLATNANTVGLIANTKAILANAAAWLASPIGWVAVGLALLIGAFVVATSIMKANSEAIQNNADKLREESAAAKEARDAQQELTNTYEDALKVYEDTREAYEKGEGSATAMLEAQKKLHEVADDIIESTDKESLALAELSGNYDKVTESIREYQAAKDEEARRAAELAEGANEAAFVDSMRKGTGYVFAGSYNAAIGPGLSTGDEKEAYNTIQGGDYSHITTDRDSLYINSGESAKEMLEAYREAEQLLIDMKNNGVDATSELYTGLSDWLDKSREDMQAYSDSLDEMQQYKIADAVDSVFFDADSIDSLEEFQAAKEEYIAGVREAAGEDADAAEEAANAFLSANEAISEFAKQDLGLDALAKETGIAKEELQSVMSDLGEDSALIFKVDFTGYNGEPLDQYVGQQMEYIKAQAGVFDIDLRISNIKDAMGLLKEDMTAEDITGLQNALDWGDAEAGIIEFNDFMAMSYEQQQQYLTDLTSKAKSELLNSLGDAVNIGEAEYSRLTEHYNEVKGAADETSVAIAKLNEELNRPDAIDVLGPDKIAEMQQELQKLEEQHQIELQVVADAEQAVGNVETQLAANKDRFTIELQLATNEFKQQLAEARDSLQGISASDFVGSIDEQISTLNQFNQQLATLGLEGITEDFFALTDAEQEQVLTTQRLVYAQNEYNEAVTAAGAGSVEANIAMKNLTDATAEMFDLDADNLESYAKHIQEVAESSDLLSDSLKDNKKAALDVATATIRANRGFNDLDGKLEDIRKAFDEADEGSERFKDALNDVRGPMEDILNVDPGTLSAEFLSSTEALDLLQQAIDGDVGALWELQQLAATTYLADIVPPEALSQIQQLEQELLAAVDAGWELGEITPDMDISNFLGKAQEIINQSHMTADQANAYFKQLGFDVKFKTEPQEVTTETVIPSTTETVDYVQKEVPQTTYDMDGNPVTRTNLIPEVKRTTIDTSTTETTTAMVDAIAMSADGDPVIESITNTGSAGTKGGSTMRSKPNRGSGGKGSGGGGGKKGGGGGKSNIPKATRDNTPRERFTDITAALDGVAKSLDRVNNAEDKAFGANKLLLMQKKNKELQEQGKLYNKLIKEAEAYLKTDDRNQGMAFGKTSSGEDRLLGGVMGDIDRLKQMASIFKDIAGINLTPEFNSEGYIANAEQMIDAINAKLQEQWDSSTYWNATEKTYAFTSEAAEASYNNLKEMADGYKEQMGTVDSTNDKMKEGLEKGLENIHTWLSNKLTEVEYKMELRIRINQRDIDQLQWLMGRLSKQASVAAMDNLNTQVNSMLKNAKALSDAAERYLEIEKNLSAGSEHQSWFRKEFGEEAWNEYQKTGHITEEMMDKMTATAEEMQELIRQLWELNSQMWAMWHEALQGYIDEFDNLIGMYDSHASMIDSWANIWKVAGSPWKDQRLQIDLLNKSIDNQSSKVQGLQQKYEFLNSKIADAEALYQRALNDYADDPEGQIIIEERRKEWEELKTQALEAKADMMSEVSAMMDMIANAAAEAASVIVNEFTEGLSGIFSSVDSALDMFDQKKSIDNFFMHEEDLGFELSKMAREMEKEMEGVTDPALLEKYHSWMEKINGMYYDENGIKKANVQMTETELEILKAEFDLEKAQAAWKEQQAQKNTMRLARDASGNWSYLYSADGGEEDDTEADIEEKIHNIRKMHRDAADEASEMWLQVWAEYRKYIEEIDWQRYEQNEAYRNEVDTRMGWYEQQLDLHAGQIVKHNEAIDRSFEDMTLSVITDTKDMMDLNNLYKQNNQDLTDALKSNHDEYQLKAKETLEAVGISYDNLKNEIEADTDAMMRKNKENEEAIKKLRRTADAELEAIMRKTMAWADRWRDEIRSIIAALDELIQKIFEMERAQAGGGGDFDRNTDYAGKIQETINDDSLSKEEQKRRVEADAERRWYKIVEARELLEREQSGEKIDWSIYRGGKSDALNIANEWGSDLTSQSRERYIQEWLDRYNFDTGGLATGPQVAGLAMDGKKEIVLNASDTENFLEAISIMRDGIASYLSNIGMKQAGLAGAIHPQTSDTASDQSPVIIQADFPNVTAREEIEAAFANLVNQAAQYKLKPRD